MKNLEGSTRSSKRIIFTMRVDDAGRASIAELAKRQNVSEGEAVRRAIADALAKMASGN